MKKILMGLLAATMLSTGAGAFQLGGVEINESAEAYNDGGAYFNNFAGYEGWVDVLGASEFSGAHEDGWVGYDKELTIINDGSHNTNVLLGATIYSAINAEISNSVEEATIGADVDVIVDLNGAGALTKSVDGEFHIIGQENQPPQWQAPTHATNGGYTLDQNKGEYIAAITNILNSDAVFVQSATMKPTATDGNNVGFIEYAESEYMLDGEYNGQTKWTKTLKTKSIVTDECKADFTVDCSQMKYVGDINTDSNFYNNLDTSGLILVGAIDSNNNLLEGTARAGDMFKHNYVVTTGEGFGNAQANATSKVGALALLVQSKFNTTKAQTANIIKFTADDLGAVGVDNVYGFGKVNIAAAMNPMGALN